MFLPSVTMCKYRNTSIKSERKGTSISFILLGWDTVTKHIEQSEALLHKYFPKFVKKSKPVKAKIELPDGALGKELSKKNYIDYLKKDMAIGNKLN
ncbi:hypothetical protein EJ377_16685 [Chryseobacterium arthrosphaerae]|uniref:Uncharacterized protein n=1 Tax=Chryseobacterium arthrosphaerae TaxID=651561 RepID=A0A3S0Q4C2_9FLAO|nr:hypothetical protein EJ377_16685 [Chryseobacterium arthrosphaerae]